MTTLNISDENIALFNKLRMENYYSYILFGLSADNSTLEFRGSGDKNYKFDSITSELPKQDVMFVIYNFEYETYENPPRTTSKLLLISWSPIVAPMKRKFALPNAVAQLKDAFRGIQKDFQLTDYAKINYEDIRRELNRV